MVCPKCGMNIDDDSNFCVYCGHQLNNDSQVVTVDYNKQQNEDVKTYVMMAASIVNLFVVFPIVTYFAFAWLIFGALSDSTALYYGILIACLVYFVFSLVFFASGISKGILKSTRKNNTYPLPVKIVVIAIFLIVMTALIIQLIEFF